VNLVNSSLRLAVGALGTTWRIRVHGAEHLRRLRGQAKPFIFALWHRDLLPLMWHHRGQGTTLVVSMHRDGDRLAQAARGWGYRVISGSSTRGGTTALRQMVRALAGGREVALTPDGPRGPARQPKPGVVLAAQRARVPVLPVAAVARPAVSLASWDRFVIPAPFAEIHISYLAPIEFAPGREARMAGIDLLQARLEEASMVVAGC
jgi:lysophospholipid acyltransferase (LPLAT)-like uncharacterized protein